MLILGETGGGNLTKTLYFCSIKLRLLDKTKSAQKTKAIEFF